MYAYIAHMEELMKVEGLSGMSMEAHGSVGSANNPYKGDASYYSIPAGGDRSRNAVWTYETPFEAMTQIKDYLAFYPDRVDEIS
jgi:uncharacterized protein (DUF427 family)